tara:strand:+ start:3744 stop:4973 length:1230 start_codon:yes stop_codon:yes gene_type:complete
MSDTVISVENLSKCYLVGHQDTQEQYQSFRDTLVRHGKNFGRKAIDMARGRQIIQGDTVEEFWALKDVSFEVKQGEALGIIGHNGAGKSTLLKLLSRITEPSKGRITLHGRVSSLLEVGTGFHPELTGRENIFLNGAILGMNKSEIRAKFDEIVAFAGVEKFLDTPVKRYSSGMYVRLAFAVAAHLESEILVVDEVLAVGDMDFQKKCLGKMNDITQTGRTVLFVSHNLQAVRKLCDSGIVLSSGQVTFHGEVEDSIAAYKECSQFTQRELKGDSKKPHMTKISVCEETLKKGSLKFTVHYKSPNEISTPLVGMVINDELGSPVIGHNTWMDETYEPMPGSEGKITLTADNLPLHSGVYYVSAFFGNQNENTHVERDFIELHIDGDPLPRGLSKSQIGSTELLGKWRCE